MTAHKSLNARARPPLIIQDAYKYHKNRYKNFDPKSQLGGTYLDLQLADSTSDALTQVSVIDSETIVKACLALEDDPQDENVKVELQNTIQPRPVFEHSDLPGFLIVPSLYPSRTQRNLVDKLLHRDLSNPDHLTNVHFHHRLTYPPEGRSFFSLPLDSYSYEPLDPTSHKAIPLDLFLTRKLRWTTLGGQYDWTAKKYPDEKPPDFPPDVANLLETCFPQMRAEAAIVNVYTPGDVLAMHRDVAEESDKGLISVSIGCDAIFVIGLGPDDAALNVTDGAIPEQKPPLVVRLRSGDAVFMGGSSRFAWHGVPQIIPGTCPDFLKNWPASNVNESKNEYEQWRGWMTNKRINLNVRQMWD